MNADAVNQPFDPVVYIVHNDSAMQRRMKTVLLSLNTTVRVFARADDFLGEPLMVRPHCLLLQQELATGDAVEVLRLLKSREVQIPTIVIAANSDVRTAVLAMRTGAVDFLVLPLVERVLFQKVKNILINQ